MTRIGFTGSRNGMTDAQKELLTEVLATNGMTSFVHGGATGADTEAHDIASWVPITVMPGCDKNGVPRNPREWGDADVEKALPFLVRNLRIINDSDMMVACPDSMMEIGRSGTWSTIRQTRKKRVPLVIIFPDGTIETENV